MLSGETGADMPERVDPSGAESEVLLLRAAGGD